MDFELRCKLNLNVYACSSAVSVFTDIEDHTAAWSMILVIIILYDE
jgi:hypothetical protein